MYVLMSRVLCIGTMRENTLLTEAVCRQSVNDRDKLRKRYIGSSCRSQSFIYTWKASRRTSMAGS